MDDQTTEQFGSRARRRGRLGVGGAGGTPQPLSHYQARLAALRAYSMEHGDSLVPQSFVTADGIALGVWVKARRQQRGEHPELDRMLAAVPGWAWSPGSGRRAEDVARRLDVIEAWRLEHGGRMPGDRSTMYMWVSRIRAAYRRGELTADVVAVCDARKWWSWTAVGPTGPLTHRPPSAYTVELAAAQEWATVVAPAVRRWLPASGEVRLPDGRCLRAWLRNRLVVGREFTHPSTIAVLEAMGYVRPERA